MSAVALPDKTILMPGQERVSLGHGFANGKPALIIIVEGQAPKAVELEFDDAVMLAHGILNTAIEAKKARANNGPILQTDGSRAFIG